MFTRFAASAKRAVVEARLLAASEGKPLVYTTHLLGGVARAEGVAATILTDIGFPIPSDAVPIPATRVFPSFTGQTTHVFERALDEALALGNNYVEDTHLLLALLSTGAAEEIEPLASPDTVRHRIVSHLTATTLTIEERVEIPPALILVLLERRRQVAEEEFDLDHDDEHTGSELAFAAACYAAPDSIFTGTVTSSSVRLKEAWPWSSEWDKRDPDVRGYFPDPLDSALRHDEALRERRIRELVKAGALIVAEIERIERMDDART